jgi:hypothetical protein
MNEDRAQRIAEAALMVWSGLNYGDYLDTLKMYDWAPGGNAPDQPITLAEWEAAEKIEDQLLPILTQLILKVSNQNSTKEDS